VIGRPSIYSDDLAQEICRRLADGESLRSICRDDDMPAKSTVLLWVVTPGHLFSDQYARAREAAGYSHADEMVDLRHRVLSGDVEPNAGRVVADMLKWSAERMAPKKHSPRQEVTGPGGGAVQVSRIEIVPGGE
jgi:hypothetical protein